MKKIIRRICRQCGRKFMTRDPNMFYCNLGCESDAQDGAAKKRALRTCRNCGTEFLPNTGKQVYCSKKCGDEFFRRKQKEETQPMTPGETQPMTPAELLAKMEPDKGRANAGYKALAGIRGSVRTCARCGREYNPASPAQKYCSYECLRLKNMEKARTGQTEQTEQTGGYPPKTCPDCGNTFRPGSNRQRRCPDCQRDRRNARNKKYYEEKKMEKPETAIINQTPTGLAGYIAELERDISGLEKASADMAAVIRTNEAEICIKKDVIERLRHIAGGTGND